MKEIWFTADWHFNHKRIIRYVNRPFETVQVMNYTLLTNHFVTVDDTDTTYHLGDFALYMTKDQMKNIVKLLRGTNILIMGNHDRFTRKKYLEFGFDEVYKWHTFEEYNLVHDPVAACGEGRHHKWLCGHVHDMWKQYGNVVNVGVDVWNFRPVNLEEIRKIL